jgi:chromate transport protein ChrA
MISETKDSIANVATIVATGSAMVDWTSTLTMILVITGIVFNVVRIIEIRTKRKED